MRVNKFIALHSKYSRREADALVLSSRVKVNGVPAIIGQIIQTGDKVTIDNDRLVEQKLMYVIMNKPVGYVCSRRGQSAPSILELLPPSLRVLNSVGRLDKDSCGLLLLTNDGDYAHQMTHPSFQKDKVYEVELDADLAPKDFSILQAGVKLDDGLSRLSLAANGDLRNWLVTIHEGKNRQIRRSFASLGYKVNKLKRISFGPYILGDLPERSYKQVEKL